MVPKLKTPHAHVNPYYDIWAWTNQKLEWAGPDAGTKDITISHALLPVLYHHFGCIVPSYEALCLINQLAAKGRTVLDLGSGNGYWTYMLRRFDSKKPLQVVPVDNGLSEWRTVWIGDTVNSDGVEWLQQHDHGKDVVLLLVYPQVGADFTGKVLRAYSESSTYFVTRTSADPLTKWVIPSSLRARRMQTASLLSPRKRLPNGWRERCQTSKRSCRFLFPALRAKTRHCSLFENPPSHDIALC